VAVDLIVVIPADLIEFWSADIQLNELWANALALCEQCGIEAFLHDGSDTLASSRLARKRRLKARLGDSCITDTVGDRQNTHSILRFKSNFISLS
jgi:hypothetical protein